MEKGTRANISPARRRWRTESITVGAVLAGTLVLTVLGLAKAGLPPRKRASQRFLSDPTVTACHCSGGGTGAVCQHSHPVVLGVCGAAYRRPMVLACTS